MEIFNFVVQVSQGILAVLSLGLFLIKPFRNWILGAQERNQQKEQRELDIDEALRCSLRNIITEFYYTHYETKTLHQYEYENISKVYAAYKRMNGNSFVDKIWEEIQGWEIVV